MKINPRKGRLKAALMVCFFLFFKGGVGLAQNQIEPKTAEEDGASLTSSLDEEQERGPQEPRRKRPHRTSDYSVLPRLTEGNSIDSVSRFRSEGSEIRRFLSEKNFSNSTIAFEYSQLTEDRFAQVNGFELLIQTDFKYPIASYSSFILKPQFKTSHGYGEGQEDLKFVKNQLSFGQATFSYEHPNFLLHAGGINPSIINSGLLVGQSLYAGLQMGAYLQYGARQELGVESQYFIPNSEIEPKTKVGFNAVPDFKSLGLTYLFGQKDASFIKVKAALYEFSNLSPETAKESELYGNSIKQYSLDLKEFAYAYKGSEVQMESTVFLNSFWNAQIKATQIQNFETVQAYRSATSLTLASTIKWKGKGFTPSIKRYEIARDAVAASLSSARGEYWGTNRQGFQLGFRMDWLKENFSLAINHNENNPILLDDSQDKFSSTGILMELKYE